MYKYLVDPASTICLSQGLSHARVSKSERYKAKLRMAHYISFNFLDGQLHCLWSFRWLWVGGIADNCGNSRANTWKQTRLMEGEALSKHCVAGRRARDRIALCLHGRRVIQGSDLSARWYGIGIRWRWRVTENWGSIPERGPERWPPLLREAAGAKITQSRYEEVATINNNAGQRSAIGMRAV